MNINKLWKLAVNDNKVRKTGFNKKMINCREKGILYRQICYHCGRELIMCKKYNGLCTKDCKF